MRFILFSLAVTVAVACSADPAPTKKPSSSSSGAACPKNESSTATVTPVPHFEADILIPIIVPKCALSACHGAAMSPQGVYLSADKAATYKALMASSKRFNGTKLVEPGKPEASLVQAKMDGTQNDLPGCKGECGKSMPPPEDDDCGEGELLPKKDRDAMRTWIKEGAKDD